jgi:hypothetical protein
LKTLTRIWSVTLSGRPREIKVTWSLWTGGGKIWVDGQPVMWWPLGFKNLEVKKTFWLDGTCCTVTKTASFAFRCELELSISAPTATPARGAIGVPRGSQRWIWIPVVASWLVGTCLVGFIFVDALWGIWPPVERYRFSGETAAPNSVEALWVEKLAHIVASPESAHPKERQVKLAGILYQYGSVEPIEKVELLVARAGWKLRARKLRPNWSDFGPASVRHVCTDQWLLSPRHWYALRGGSFDGAVLMVVERWRDFELMSAGYATAEHAGVCGTASWSSPVSPVFDTPDQRQ